ncbi:MAG: hypothetical protein RRZ24_11155 [Clostridia bacterium]
MRKTVFHAAGDLRFFYTGDGAADQDGDCLEQPDDALTATDLINRIYDDAIFAGVHPIEFWELSYGEISAVIKSFNRHEKQRAEEWKAEKEAYDRYLAVIAYKTAALIAAMCFSKRPPTFEDAFPEFNKKTETEKQPTWQQQQAGMTAWVEAYNAKYRSKDRTA